MLYAFVVAAYLVHIRRDSAGVLPGTSSSNEVVVAFFLYSGRVTVRVDVSMFCRFDSAYDSYQGSVVVGASTFLHEKLSDAKRFG